MHLRRKPRPRANGSSVRRWWTERRIAALHAALFLASRVTRTNLVANVRVLAGQRRQDRRLGVLVSQRAARPSDRVRVVVVQAQRLDPRRDAGSARMLDICRAMLELDCSIAVIGQLDETAGDVSAAGEVVLREQPFLVAAADDLRAADIVWCCGAPATARVVSSLRHLRERPMLVFDSVDLSHVRYAREARVTGSRRVRLQAGLARRLERLEASFADCVVAVTDEERDVVLDEVRGARVVVMPTYQELPREPTPGPEDRAGILFFGSFLHSPNVDAVEHLIHDIAPMIWSRLPEATITIAGSGPLPDGAPHEERVRMLGWVEDLDALMDASRVLLAPLRFGAGMKGKIARSLARGLPVATTPVGAEGLHLVPAHSAFVSDRDAELAHGCVELLVDDERWRRMSEEGQRVAASQLARSGAAAPLVEILESARLGR